MTKPDTFQALICTLVCVCLATMARRAKNASRVARERFRRTTGLRCARSACQVGAATARIHRAPLGAVKLGSRHAPAAPLAQQGSINLIVGVKPANPVRMALLVGYPRVLKDRPP